MLKKVSLVFCILVVLSLGVSVFGQEEILYVMDDGFKVVGGGGLDEIRIPSDLRILGDWCGTSYDDKGSGSYGWLCKYANPSSFRVEFTPYALYGNSVAKACIRNTPSSTNCIAGTAGSAAQ